MNNKFVTRLGLHKFVDFSLSLIASALIFYLYMGGFARLNPRNFQWISGDNTSGYIAQLFYIQDKWRFPLGANPNFGKDLSTTLTYSGPPYPIALIQKSLHVDPSLQFIGMWLLLVIFLQIYLGIMLAREVGATSLQSRLFGLMQVTPFFIMRFQLHFWLTSHFLILWALLIAARYFRKKSLMTISASVLIFVAYLINSYLLVMVLIILLVPLIQILFEGSLPRFIWSYVSVLFSLFMVFLIFDFDRNSYSLYEKLRMSFTGEYSYFPSNILAPLNPQVGFGRSCELICEDQIPDWITNNFSMSNIDLGGVKGNLDAYLYFGVGLLLFSLISIFVTLKKRREFIPFFKSRFGKTILLIAVLLWCYSVTYRISFGSHEIGLDAPKILRWALSMFRSSGRFMWILSYALFILGLFVLLRFLNQKKVTAILLICLSVQTLDMAPILWKRHTFISNAVIPDAIPLDAISVRKFSKVSFGKKEFLIFPPTSMKGWPTLPYLAWKNGLSSGFFQSSRVNYTAAKRVQSRLRQIVCEERLPDTWLVAIPSDELQLFEGCNLDTYRLDEFEGHTFIFR